MTVLMRQAGLRVPGLFGPGTRRLGEDGDVSSGGLMKLWIRAVLFTLLMPGSVAVLIPWLLSRSFATPLDLGPGRFAGIPVLACGVALYLTSALSFVVKGKGTPAIWFIRPLRTVLGEEPNKLVRGVSYRWTRNPMYLGVVLSRIRTGAAVR